MRTTRCVHRGKRCDAAIVGSGDNECFPDVQRTQLKGARVVRWPASGAPWFRRGRLSPVLSSGHCWNGGRQRPVLSGVALPWSIYHLAIRYGVASAGHG
jgi:hypothetical protein